MSNKIKKIILLLTILITSTTFFTHFWGNLYSLTTCTDYFIPVESNIFAFKPTQWNDGSGDWWLYGEDGHYYYALNDKPNYEPKYFSLHKGLESNNFDKFDYTTWLPTQMDSNLQAIPLMPVQDSGRMSIDSTKKLMRFDSKYNFKTFNVDVFTGKLAQPIFTKNDFGTDKEFVELITTSCNKNGINFGGHYTIIQVSCGCMCEGIYVVDRISGKLFWNIAFNNEGKWGYRYKADSKLIIANSECLIHQDSLIYDAENVFGKPELWMWAGNNFKRLQ